MIRIEKAGHWFRPSAGCFAISPSLAPARIGTILGPNGCGKTTLLRAICGTLTSRNRASPKASRLRAAGPARRSGL